MEGGSGTSAGLNQTPHVMVAEVAKVVRASLKCHRPVLKLLERQRTKANEPATKVLDWKGCFLLKIKSCKM